MKRKDVKRMTKEHDNTRSIAFTYKLILSIIAFFLIFMVAMVLGAADTSIKDVWLALTSSAKGDKISIIREIRLPREVAAIFVGAGLAVSGAIMQGLTRNPLADPGLLGLSGGANAALALTLAFNPSISYLYLTLACFIGAAVGAIMVFGIGMVKKAGSPSSNCISWGCRFSISTRNFRRSRHLLQNFTRCITLDCWRRNWNYLEPIESYYSSHFN